MRLKNVIRAVVCVMAFALAGCSGTAGFRNKEALGEQSLKGATVLIVAPQVQLYEIGVGQQKSRRADLEEPLRKTAVDAITEFAQESGWFKVATMPKLNDSEQYEFDQRMTLLYSNQLEYAAFKTKKGGALAEVEDRLNASVGRSPLTAEVIKRTGARYALLFAGSDSYTTASAKLVSLASAVVTMGNTPMALTGLGTLTVCVIDLQTGKVIWMADDTSKRDLTDKDNQKKMLRTLLKRSPLGGD